MKEVQPPIFSKGKIKQQEIMKILNPVLKADLSKTRN